MFKQFVFSIYDKVSGLYGAPLCFVNDNVAKRHFLMVCDKAEFDPTDLELYSLGTYDVERGQILAFEQPKFIMRGIDNEPSQE